MIELRHALRSVRSTPVYSLAVIAVIAITMTLATTVFAVVDGVLFKPLPFPDVDRLYTAGPRAEGGRSGGVFKVDEIASWRRALPNLRVSAFEAASEGGSLGDGRVYSAASVDAHFFDVLGAWPRIGGFSPDHFVVGSTPVAIISHRLWQRAFGGRPDVLGQTLPLVGGVNHRGQPIGRAIVVGVLAPDFVFPLSSEIVDVIRPQRLTAQERASRNESAVIALLRWPADLSMPALQSALDAATVAAQSPDEPARRRMIGANLRSMADVGISRRGSFRTLVLVTGALVILACLGVGGLAAARSRQRQRDVMVRRALGATTWDLFRQSLLEAAPLVFVGAAIALLLAPSILSATLALLPISTGFVKAPRIDLRVAMVAGGLASICTLWVSLGVLRASRAGRLASLERTSSSGRLKGFSRALVAVQAGTAFLLSVGGALLLTSLWHVWRVDPGYDSERLAVLEVTGLNRDFQAVRAEVLQLTDELGRLPGVSASGLFGSRILSSSWGVTSATAQQGNALLEFQGIGVERDLFQALGLRSVRGRLPSQDEIARRDPLVIISERAAASLAIAADPVGRTLYFSRGSVTIIGVVPDIELSQLGDPPREAGQIYHLGGGGGRAVSILLRTLASPRAILPEAIRVVRSRPQQFDLLRSGTMDQILAESIRERRFSAWTYGAIAGSALVIVGVSILGLVAMVTSLRTRELGVRIALGASRGRVVALVLREQVLAAAIGLVAGGVATTWTVRALRRQVFGITTTDPWVWGATALVILIMATLGVLLPALRASRVDPVKVLRAD